MVSSGGQIRRFNHLFYHYIPAKYCHQSTSSVLILCLCPFHPVLYVERCQRHRWRCAEVTFACPDEALCQLWISSIREQLTATSTTQCQHTCTWPACERRRITESFLFPSASRPKHLLVYINPYGGKRKGEHIYELKVAPLFAQAGIRTHVIGSCCLNHFLCACVLVLLPL